mmetsp:Transcript_86476/g.253078  ORF Transcript_86476/g.253078 Transcript_86476/m.253078 type:complete len:599 (-) Transcript_86476:184-1980(-)
MRQPLALELRCGAEDFGSFNGPEAEAWLQSISKAVSQAVGHRLKVEPLRLRLSVMGCANLDVVDLPEKGNQPNGGTPAKLEEMRARHVGSSSNLLVCVEPGPPLELCRRYDPQLRRTVLLGAAAASIRGGDDPLPPSMLCGPAAARSLEEKFAILCHERVPQWTAGLERLEARLEKSRSEAREIEQRETSDEVLRRARSAGTSFGRALEHVIHGAPGCTAGALTLEDELVEFAASAAKGHCGTGAILSPQDAASAVADLFANFDGVEGYANYLRTEVRVPGADVPLNGGAAWQRLLAEIEVAMRLSHPPPDELAGLMLNAVRAGGTGVHGHQRWEDVSSKLMLAIAFEPLRRRIRYVAARVVWVLKHQKAAVSEWMSTLSDGPASRLYSPLFSEHLSILRQYPIVRELVFGAYNDAVSIVGEQVLKSLEGTLMAACINPEIMLRTPTEPDLDPRNPANAQRAKSGKAGKASQARERVANEMRRRGSGPSGGLPVQLRDRIFEPKEAAQTLPFVEVKLRHAFAVLANILANQSFAFSDTSLATLCRRQVDEAMNKIDYSAEQSRALAARHTELEEVAKQVEERLSAVKRCLQTLRSSRA